jgi:uncharacterized membrane protein
MNEWRGRFSLWKQSVLIFVVSIGLAARPAHAVRFLTPDLPGSGSTVLGLSGDGRTVLGYLSPNLSSAQGFSWTEASGVRTMDSLLGQPSLSFAFDASFDGAMVVGHYQVSGVSSQRELGVRWMAGGMDLLGDLAGGTETTRVDGVSADGTTVFGYSHGSAGYEAFRWTKAMGIQGLGDLPGGGYYSYAVDASADGSTVVGSSSSLSSPDSEAFVWTEQTGMQKIFDLPAGAWRSFAGAVSDDGSTIVGSFQRDQSTDAYRWTAAGGLELLGQLSTSMFRDRSEAVAVSADGLVVGGNSDGFNEAFRWTATQSMRSIRSLLTSGGVDVSSWSTLQMCDMSDDGNVFLGMGSAPNGEYVPWIADFTPVPEPTSVASCAYLLGALIYRSRSQSNDARQRDLG